ncbi:MAG: UDP-galactopyranose mutase [Deltaproteobacteria bacterium]|jgi:UDP-galactopyranose mutase|nr:UDP-galactopyranose mutase [Deltaproteobacteria bacterium]
MKKILIVGAGLTGATLARTLAESGCQIEVIDERNHVAGNCHTETDPETGIMIQKYGAHIFHTDQDQIWSFVNRFSVFMPFNHKVKTISNQKVYSLPINLMTINQFFSRAFSPAEAREYLTALTNQDLPYQDNFEGRLQKLIGTELYAAFFYGYTKKQWGRQPRELPASIFERLPIRFNYNDDYFNNRYQGLPELGYTDLVSKMLDLPNITVSLNTAYHQSLKHGFDHVFYSGPLDRYFGYSYGRLPYRTVDFQWFRAADDYQGCAVMNYSDELIPWTRIIEHKHFTYWHNFEDTVCCREIPKECGESDTPYYPVRFASNNDLLAQYQALASAERALTFVGRLGAFKYLDMDKAINEALEVARWYLQTL